MTAGQSLGKGTMRSTATATATSTSTSGTRKPFPLTPSPAPATTPAALARDRTAFTSQLKVLQQQAAARNGGAMPSLAEHPAFRGTPMPFSHSTDVGRPSADLDASMVSTVGSESDKLYIHTWSSPKSFGGSSDTATTSLESTPEKAPLPAYAVQQPVGVKRKPVPVAKDTSTGSQPKSHPQPDVDPIAAAASRAAALRIRRKTIPRPISIVAPLPNLNVQARRGNGAGTAKATPLPSGSLRSGRNAAESTPWTDKYGPNTSMRSGQSTPSTSNSLKSALKGFAKEWKAQMNDSDAPAVPPKSAVKAKTPVWTGQGGPPSDWEYAKDFIGKVKEHRYEKKRAEAIEEAKSAKLAAGSAAATPKTAINIGAPVLQPRPVFRPHEEVSENPRRIELKRAQSGKSERQSTSTSRTPLSAKFFFGLRTPKTPKTPKTPRSSTYAPRRPSFFSTRSRSNSVISASGPKTPKTPRTPFTPSELTSKVGGFFSKLGRKSGPAAAPASAPAYDSEVDAQDERRQQLKAAISRPSDDGRVFAADAFDPAAVARRRDELLRRGEEARAKKRAEAQQQVPELILGVGPNGEKRQTTIGEFIDAAAGRHPLLQPQVQLSGKSNSHPTSSARHTPKPSTSSMVSAVSAALSNKSKTAAAADKGKGKAASTTSSSADGGKPNLMSRISDFGKRRSSADSDASFMCAGAGSTDEDNSFPSFAAAAQPASQMAQHRARENTRCKTCGASAFGLSDSGLCDNCEQAEFDTYEPDTCWPKRDASLPRSDASSKPESSKLMSRSSSFYSTRPGPSTVYAKPALPPVMSRGRHTKTYSDAGNPYANEVVSPLPLPPSMARLAGGQRQGLSKRRTTLDPDGALGLWDTDSWLESNNGSKQSSLRVKTTTGIGNGAAGAQGEGEHGDGRDTGFYRFYDELLQSPVMKFI